MTRSPLIPFSVALALGALTAVALRSPEPQPRPQAAAPLAPAASPETPPGEAAPPADTAPAPHAHAEPAVPAEARPAAVTGERAVGVCAQDASIGLSGPGDCPLDGEPMVQRTVDLSAMKDLRNERCPVMGGKAKPDVFAFHSGHIVHFCCPGCDDDFFADAPALIAKLGGAASTAAPKGDAAAPSTEATKGGAVDLWVCQSDPSIGLSYEGTCPLDGAPLVKRSIDRGSLVDLKNPTCPIMGGEADGETFAIYKGKMVHFCCPGCDEDFFQSPTRYIAEIEAE
jgi:YHS domain-containing protein